MTIEIQHTSFWPTGSQYICNPPVMNTDQDWVVLVEDLKAALQQCKENGWETSGKEYGDGDEVVGDWFSVKKKINDVLVNYIVVGDNDLFRRWVTATELAKKLNLTKKDDRVFLFEVVVREKPLF